MRKPEFALVFRDIAYQDTNMENPIVFFYASKLNSRIDGRFSVVYRSYIETFSIYQHCYNTKKRGFRAQHYAAQSPSNYNLNVTGKLKGGIAMVKTVLCKIGTRLRTALIILGWISFFASFLINEPTLVISLQTIARVLP